MHKDECEWSGVQRIFEGDVVVWRGTCRLWL